MAIVGHVQRLFGRLQGALGKGFLGADDTHTGTQLQARGQLAVLGGLRTGLATDLIEQVLEFGAVALEAGRRDVGQVVGDGRQVGVLSGQTSLGDIEGGNHRFSPSAPGIRRQQRSIS